MLLRRLLWSLVGISVVSLIHSQSSVALDRLNEGWSYSKLGEHSKAVDVLTKAIGEDPKSAASYSWRANSYRILGQKQKAIEDLSKVIELDSGAYAMSALKSRAALYFELGDYKLAKADLEASITRDTKNSELYLQLGRVDDELKLFDESILAFSKAIEINPNDPGVYLLRAFSYLESGQKDKAHVDLKKIHSLDPNFLRSFRNRARKETEPGEVPVCVPLKGAVDLLQDESEISQRRDALDNLGRYQDAIGECEKLIRLKPKDVELLTKRAEIYLKAGQQEKATDDYNSAVALAPDDEKLLIERADFFERIKQPGKRLSDLGRAIESYGRKIIKSPTNASLYDARAEVYSNLHKYKEAISDYSKAISLEPDKEHYFGRGRCYDELKQYDKAIADYSKAIAVDPNLATKDPVAYYWRGDARMMLRQYADSIKDFSKAIEIDPQCTYAIGQRSRAYFAIGDLLKSLADCNTLLEREPEESAWLAWRHLLVGIRCIEVSNDAQAIDELNSAIKLEPTLTLAFCQRGDAYSRLEMYQEAINDYTTAVKLDKGDSRVFAGRAAAYSGLNDKQNALIDFNKAISLDPKFQWAYYRRGLLQEVTNPQKALEDFTAAINLDPKDDRAYFMRGKVYLRLGQNVKADSDFNKVLAISPKGRWAADVCSLRAQAYEKAGKYQLALSELDKGLQINPNDRQHLLKKAQLYRAMGQHQKALIELDKVIKFDPSDNFCLYTKALIYRDLGQHDKGIKCLEKSIETFGKDKSHAALIYYNQAIKDNPKSAWTYAGRGRVFFERLQYFDKAIEDCTLAIALDPKCADAYFYRGLAYRKQKQQDKALADFKQAIALDQKFAEKIALSN